jgi:glutathione S-transferase
MFQKTFVDYGELPNMTAWFERCKNLPGFEENFAGAKAIAEMMATKEMEPVSLA